MPQSPTRARGTKSSKKSPKARKTRKAPKKPTPPLVIDPPDSDDSEFPHTIVKRSEVHGRGLFAAEKISKGEQIGVYEGPRTQRNGAYVLWVEEDDDSYGIAGKNEMRFVNHSKRPNAAFEGEELWSIRVIKPEEEITFDYGEDWD